VKRREGLRLPSEPRKPLGVIRERRRPNPDGDVPIELGVARTKLLPRATRPKREACPRGIPAVTSYGPSRAPGERVIELLAVQPGRVWVASRLAVTTDCYTR
jgi:hypothetical protein